MNRLEHKINQVRKESFPERVKALPIRCLVKKSSDVIRSLEDCKMDVKSFVFIKSPRIEKVINARQHFFRILSSAFRHFYFIFLIYLKLTTLPVGRVVMILPIIIIL